VVTLSFAHAASKNVANINVMLQGNRILNIYKFHALITTYEVIISDLEELSAIDWRVAIIDEAHRLKNRNCKLLQGLGCFDMVGHCHACWLICY